MKTCLVLEGGALRGIYTAGVLDALQEENIKIDAIIGVSMGTLLAVNYISKQPGRALRYNLNYCRDENYISFYSFLKTGDLVNKKLAYYDIPDKLDKFDYKEFKKSNIKLYCTVTNVENGKAEYIEIKDAKKEVEYLRAGASMPGVSKIVEINAKKYLDGGIADSIPVEKAIEMGYDRIVVVLTRPFGYRKKPSKLKLLSFLYRKYPQLVQTISMRNIKYNQTLDKLIELKKQKQIFIIYPSQKIAIKRVEHNPKMIQAQYDLGLKDFNSKKKELYEYLKD